MRFLTGFLPDASQDKNLAIFRKESEVENDDDEEANDGEARKPPKRMFSQTLKDLIGHYDEEFACDENRSDLTCLKKYIEAAIPYFDYKNEDNFKKQLTQLAEIIRSL